MTHRLIHNAIGMVVGYGFAVANMVQWAKWLVSVLAQ